MVRIKSVSRANPASRGLAPKSNLYVRRNALTQSSAKKNNDKIPTERHTGTVGADDEEEPQDDTAIVDEYPSLAPTVEHTRSVDDSLEITSRIHRSSRKKYPSDAPPISKPPYLPPIMQTGCIQTTKFKCLTAPTASVGKPDWDVIKYCLDCLRPHLVLHCDGTHELVEQDCVYHRDHPDSTLRVKEYERVRKRLEKLYFDHGIMDSRPFSPPILQHHSECVHQNEADGFDLDVLNKMRETAEWGTDVSQEQLQIATAAKVDTPRRRAAQPATPRRVPTQQMATDDVQDKREKTSMPLPISYDADAIMIED